VDTNTVTWRTSSDAASAHCAGVMLGKDCRCSMLEAGARVALAADEAALWGRSKAEET
jgi:hypothetical protein